MEKININSVKEAVVSIILLIFVQNISCTLMKNTFLKRCLLLLACLLALSGLQAQNFRRGALYQVEGIPVEYEGQLVTISELSGSWRLVDPSTHRALRMGERGMEWGEENGSD